MLQPMLVRPFFRILAVPLSLAVLFAAALFIKIGIEEFGSPMALPMLLLGPSLVVGGLLGLILAFTGSLPEWVVGNGEDEDASGAT